MRRKYLVAVLLLLATGVVSTLALGTFSQSLTETLLTEYVLNYDEASAVLSSPSTTPSGDDSITVSFTVTQSGGEQQVDLSISACSDGSGSTIISAASGATYSYTVTFASGTQTATDVSITETDPLTVDITTDTGKGAITGLEVTFVNTGLVAAYNSLAVDVSDA